MKLSRSIVSISPMWLVLLLLPLLATCDDNSAACRANSDNCIKSYSGVTAHVSSMALDLAAVLISEALPKLLDNLTIPDSSGSGYSVDSMKLEKMGPTLANVSFVPDRGIAISVSLESLQVSGKYSAGIGWFSSKGKFSSQLGGLNVSMIVALVNDNVTRLPTYEVRQCLASIDRSNFIFHDGSGTAFANSLKSILRDAIQQRINVSICEPLIGPVAPFIINQTIVNNYCGINMTSREQKQSSALNGLWANMSLVREPLYLEKSALLFFDGHSTFHGRAAVGENVLLDKTALRISKKCPRHMARVIVSEKVLNSLLLHVFNQKLIKLTKTLSKQHLPPELHRPFSWICSNCELRLHAEPAAPPLAKITQREIVLTVDGLIASQIHGLFNDFDLWTGTVRVVVKLRPYVQNNKLKADISLERFHVDLKDRGLGIVLNLFAGQIPRILKDVIKRAVWPLLEEKLRHYTTGDDVALTGFCGVELKNTTISLIEGAMVAETDFQYPTNVFVQQMKRTFF